VDKNYQKDMRHRSYHKDKHPQLSDLFTLCELGDCLNFSTSYTPENIQTQTDHYMLME
jgi:hypothetical protein